MHKDVEIVLLGLGNVGAALLGQILDTRDRLAHRTGLRIVPTGLSDTSGCLSDPAGFADDTLRAALQTVADDKSLATLPTIRPLGELEQALHPGAILVDVTASPEVTPILRDALGKGCGVVLANKLPLAGDWTQAEKFFGHKKVRYEATVGAGLPVVDTLCYLLDTGDRVTAIEGCFSGTLGYLCTKLERGTPYAQAVRTAHDLGYTEPDPREDLSGRDVARKALILARTAGWKLDLADIQVEKLYPDVLAGLSAEAFLDAASSLNEAFADRFEEAQTNGKTLRYVARVDPDGGQVGLAAVPKDSPLGALHGPANYVAFDTERYDVMPLAISGSGAGAPVTAAAVLGDVIDLAQKR